MTVTVAGRSPRLLGRGAAAMGSPTAGDGGSRALRVGCRRASPPLVLSLRSGEATGPPANPCPRPGRKDEHPSQRVGRDGSGRQLAAEVLSARRHQAPGRGRCKPGDRHRQTVCATGEGATSEMAALRPVRPFRSARCPRMEHELRVKGDVVGAASRPARLRPPRLAARCHAPPWRTGKAIQPLAEAAAVPEWRRRERMVPAVGLRATPIMLCRRSQRAKASCGRKYHRVAIRPWRLPGSRPPAKGRARRCGGRAPGQAGRPEGQMRSRVARRPVP